ncbi:hypothetical protein ALC56_07225 [Trachymyrmex septentrionalis]|uniref:Uncharacterized protein n=2 Tax=Trachymyrmex septentrionalis TaxID=34720 RepID=A0A195FC30_9HYME|nr:hypothetical protein ALC56_07225 [Trachymyrmex septentrionalis]
MKISNTTSDREIILEEVIITGSGNNTRVIANAVAKDASKLDDEVFSLLSKREIQESGHSKQTSSDQDDQDAAQSRAAVINANEEDELEIMSHVIAKYEPQRLTTRKTKRKIIDGSNDTHDVHDKVEGSITDIERAYTEVLKNISRKAPELTVNNADVALNPYLSLAKKQLKQIYIPKVTIPSATIDRVEKSHSDVEPTFTLPTSNSKKSKRLLKKYLQLNRTTTIPQFSSDEESNFNEESASNKPSTPAGYVKIINGKTKVKNGSLSVPTSNVYSDPTTKNPKIHHKWNVKDSLIQTVPPLTSQLNNSNLNNIINVNNLNNLNVSNYANADQLPSKYNIVPRPFSILQSPNSFVTTNIDAPHRKPSVLSTDFNRQQQIVRSSANILPLVLPTDVFNPLATRRYVPIKRTNHLNLEGNSATIVSTETSLPTSPIGKKTTLMNYDTFYTDVIDTTRSPSVTTNNQQSHGSSDYYAITESPTERTVTKTNFATTYIPNQTSPLYTAQGQKDSQIVRKKDFLPTISSYNSLNGEKSSLNKNPETALYKKFSNLYSAKVPNVLNTPKVITQDFKQAVQPSQQQVTTLPDATSKPLTPTLLKIRPIATSKPAPYYDSRSFVLQDGKHKKNSDENVGTNEQSRVEDVDVTEKEDDDDENYKTQVNEKAYKTPNKLSEKKDREEEEEDRYPQQNRNYQDKHYEYDESDRSSKNNDRHEKYENVWRENNDDGEEDETEEDEYDGNIDRSKDEDNDDNRHQYNKYRYDRDNSDEKQHETPRHEKYNKPKDRRDKHDVDHRFEDNKYFESLYNDDEVHERNKEYRDRSDQKKLIGNNQYKKDRKYKEFEDESVAKNKPFTQRSKDSYKQDERYEEEQSNDDDKRKYHSYTSPRRDSLREKHLKEEYSESNPTHIHEEYHQRVKDDHRDDHRRHDSEDQDNGKEEARDHVHGETQEHAETHKHEEHNEKKKGIENYKYEKGGGAEHGEEHHGHEEEKGDKGYKVWHEHEKAEKGHHDKEHASKHYDENSGEEKKHEEEGGYHEEHKHGEGGKKTAEFGEKGEHKKGHSTHGEHSVHKKDEYEKKTEFFDEFNEDGGIEKHGEHHHDHESKKGGHEKKGHHDSSDHEEKYGKEGKHEKGGHHHEHKGHKVDEGHDHHYDHHHKHGKKEGHEHGKKWSFKKGDGDDHKHNR